MENQHRKIRGYRELTQVEIDLMNQIKQKGIELAELITAINSHLLAQGMAAKSDEDEIARIVAAEPLLWCGLGRKKLQVGLMELTRSVAQPEFF